jgi:death-on-curing protein
MTYFLTRVDVLKAANAACGFIVTVGDEGLLAAALARPQATLLGHDAYPDLIDKAAALMQSLATNHPLIDGNKRTAWTSAMLFMWMNGDRRMTTATLDNDAAEAFVLDVATGHQDWEKVRDGLLQFFT